LSDALSSWTTPNIYFGTDSAAQIAKAVNGRRTLVITTTGTKTRGVLNDLTIGLGSNVVRTFTDIDSNYSMADIDHDSGELRTDEYDCILAIGGGSVIDVAKCLSFLLHPDADGFSLNKHFIDGVALPEYTPIPVIAVPTTAGSGSEVTPFATVWDLINKRKYSLASDQIQPESAIVDPSLCFTLPLRTTISSGLDAISHSFESVWNINASIESTELATRSLKLSFEALPTLANSIDNQSARIAMSEASLLAGMAITTSRTALAHSMSYPLTATLGIDHGLACSFTLPAILRFNAEVDDGRLAKLATTLGKSGTDHLADSIIELFVTINLKQQLAEFDLSSESLLELSPLMSDPSRASNNLRHASIDNIDAILRESVDSLSGLPDLE
jgi:alcohol dehydrogenase